MHLLGVPVKQERNVLPLSLEGAEQGGIALSLPRGTRQAPEATLIQQFWLGLCELPKVMQESPSQSADFQCRNTKFLLVPAL